MVIFDVLVVLYVEVLSRKDFILRFTTKQYNQKTFKRNIPFQMKKKA